jgi:hypothetical protein
MFTWEVLGCFEAFMRYQAAEVGGGRIEHTGLKSHMARGLSRRYIARIVTDTLMYVCKGSVSFKIASF